MTGTVALTGATGFIGGAILRTLRTCGWRVRALYRSRSHPAFPDDAVTWVPGSLEGPEFLHQLVEDADAVVHCAGRVRGASKAEFAEVNVEGVARLASVAAARRPPPRFLLISSLAAREPCLSPYAKSKREGEQALAAAAGEMAWSVFRPPAVYGPGDREVLALLRLFSRGIAPIPSPENARFSLLYVDDLCSAVARWLKRDDCPSGPFELDDGQPGGYSWEDLVAEVERFEGRRIRAVRVPAAALRALAGVNLVLARGLRYAPMLTPAKVRELQHVNWVCDNEPLREAIGWVPRYPLKRALKDTLCKPG